MSSLFPITDNWSWLSFLLYSSIGIAVVLLCKKGAKRESLKNKSEKKHSKSHFQVDSAYIIAIIMLTALATFRSSSVGTDTPGYIQQFYYMQSFSFDWSRLWAFHQTEPGYLALIYLVRLLSDNYHLLFLIIYCALSSAYIAFIRHFYKENDNYVFLVLFIFYYTSNMSGMRAACGTIFLLFSFILLDKRRHLPAVILTIIASLFHYSMIYNFYIVFIHWFFDRTSFKKRKWIWILGIIMSIIVANIGVATLVSIFSETKYSFYTSKVNDSILGSVVFVVFGLLAFLSYGTIQRTGEKLSVLIISLAFLVTYPMIFATNAYRIPNYYILPRLVIWDNSVSLVSRFIKPDSRVFFKIILTCVVFLYLFFRFVKGSVDGGFIFQFEGFFVY